MKLEVWKFIDDFLAGERMSTDVAQKIYSEQKTSTIMHAQRSEMFFRTVVENAGKIGMHVNESKTQLLCLSTCYSSNTSSFIRTTDGSEILSGEKLKILGFYFDSDPSPSVECHVQEMIKKVKKRAWIIRNLKHARLTYEDLLKCYYSLVCPVLDYAAPVYHPMLNATQSECLEKLQRDSLKTIFGFERSYREILQDENIESLIDRRQVLFDNFALNLSQSN